MGFCKNWVLKSKSLRVLDRGEEEEYLLNFYKTLAEGLWTSFCLFSTFSNQNLSDFHNDSKQRCHVATNVAEWC